MTSMTGHMSWWQPEAAGVVEKSLLEDYGALARWKGALGVRLLYHHGSQVEDHCYTNGDCTGRPLVGCRSQGFSSYSPGF